MDNGMVKQLIADLMRERFEDAEINSISIDEDVDFDGDPILRVEVVFTAENNRLDATRTSSLLRHLRPKLSDIGVSGFPVMSFVSNSDFMEVSA